MSISNFKKLTSILATASYLSLTNFCLVSAMATGEVHHSEQSSKIDLDHDHEAHQSNHKHDASHHHDHDSSSGSDQCCTTISKDLPAILPTAHISARPNLWIISFIAISATSFINVIPAFSEFNNHDPPGLLAQQYFLSSLHPRAPPFSPSL